MKNLSTQIATTREQSERLLAMGVKPETADMYWMLDKMSLDMESELSIGKCSVVEDKWSKYTPSWSLSRLISMMPKSVNHRCSEYHFAINTCYDDSFSLGYDRYDSFDQVNVLESKESESLIECCVSMIDWLIKNNHFNKEYLK